MASWQFHNAECWHKTTTVQSIVWCLVAPLIARWTDDRHLTVYLMHCVLLLQSCWFSMCSCSSSSFILRRPLSSYTSLELMSWTHVKLVNTVSWTEPHYSYSNATKLRIFVFLKCLASITGFLSVSLIVAEHSTLYSTVNVNKLTLSSVFFLK